MESPYTDIFNTSKFQVSAGLIVFVLIVIITFELKDCCCRKCSRPICEENDLEEVFISSASGDTVVNSEQSNNETESRKVSKWWHRKEVYISYANGDPVINSEQSKNEIETGKERERLRRDGA